MNCPHCGHGKSRVLKTREELRTRLCIKCKKEFATVECLAAYAGRKAGWIHQTPPVEESAPIPKNKRAQKYHPAIPTDWMIETHPETTQLLLQWWNEARWSRHANAAWTESAWLSNANRVFAMDPKKGHRLASRGVESGWQSLQEKYLEGDTSTDDGTVAPTNPAMRAALEAWN